MENNTSVKLHLGCGDKKLDGWINIDSVKAFNPDMVLDISYPLPFEDQSVDAVLAEDLLEHFDKYMRYVVFYQWTRVLKIGGKITIQVPNFKKILFKYFKFGFNNFVDFIFGENMLGSEVYIGHFGNHKWGYSVESLKAFVKECGMETVSAETNGLNITLVAEKKKHLTDNDLNSIQIYSHNNAHGVGEASLPLDVVKEKIKIFQDQGKETK